MFHALDATRVHDVLVSTEDPEIATIAKRLGAEVISRPADLADDHATSESALLHVLDELAEQRRPEPDVVVFLQCTSPVRRHGDIDNAIALLLDREVDSVFSACHDPCLLWSSRDGELEPLNYDPASRLREQDMTTQMRENGSIYVTRPRVLRSAEHRMGGAVAVYEMDALRSVQVDGPEDLDLASWAMSRRPYRETRSWPGRIDLVVFDFDGVMTDNTVYITEEGHESVRCSRADGLGIAALREHGVPMLVLSTEQNRVVGARCSKLGIECMQGVDDKAAALAAVLRERQISAEHVAYLGNDVNDLGCLELVGLAVVVGDADARARDVACHITCRHGGHGAVREFCDLLLSRYRQATRGS